MVRRSRQLFFAALVLCQALLLARADDCNRYLRGVKNLADINQALIEDCMRTGQAQAWTTGVIASIAGAAVAGAASRALQQDNETQSQQEIQEPRSTKFRIRMDASAEGEVVIGLQWIRFVIQIWDDSTGTWGRTRKAHFVGFTGGIGAGVGLTSSSRKWSTFHTQRYTALHEIKGNAALFNYPGGDVTMGGTLALGGGFNLSVDTENEILNMDVDNTARGLHVSANITGRTWGHLF